MTSIVSNTGSDRLLMEFFKLQFEKFMCDGMWDDLAAVAFFFWLSFMLNVQRMVYGTRIDQIIFIISATIGTVIGVSVFG